MPRKPLLSLQSADQDLASAVLLAQAVGAVAFFGNWRPASTKNQPKIKGMGLTAVDGGKLA